jgi:hypothetical protein
MLSLQYLLHNGKNSKLKYYTINYARLLTPKFLFQWRLKHTLKEIDSRSDKEYIIQRVNYYNKMSNPVTLPEDATKLKDLSMKGHAKIYFFDIYEFIRWFPSSYKWSYFPGDINRLLPVYSITKSRPIGNNNENSVIMKLEKNRHFTFLHDKIPFEDKMNRVIFRGKILAKESRRKFMKMYFGNPMCDLGDVGKHSSDPPEWHSGKLTIFDHLKFKFIMSLEGNDVASNLKWVMSSNSIAVMPKPTCETWFMEGTLIPDYHYIEIKSDFSDLEERLNYFITYPDKANEIIIHAHQYIEQFKDQRREKLISLMVLDKYFKITRQSL